MDDCCCQPSGPPTLQIARAVSVLSVRTFQIHSPPGQPFFCGRRFFRQCNVAAVDNGLCGLDLPNQDSQASVPIFAEHITGLFDPCNTNELLTPFPPMVFFDTGQTCRLENCWNAIYTLTVETTPEDLIAACLANLSLIDLNQIPFGTQRRVINDFFTGAPVFSETPLQSSPLPDSCPGFLNHTLAASFTFRYAGAGEVSHCTHTRDRRVLMPTYNLVVSASRSRFNATSTWCKRTRSPILVDPDFASTCISRPGTCAETQCNHHLPASGLIDVPTLNQSVHIGLCTAPNTPCNPTPIPF